MNYSLQLVIGNDDEGKKCYSYVVVDAKTAKELESNRFRGKLEDAGVVIYSGIDTPTEEEHARAMEFYQRQILKASN